MQSNINLTESKLDISTDRISSSRVIVCSDSVKTGDRVPHDGEPNSDLVSTPYVGPSIIGQYRLNLTSNPLIDLPRVKLVI